MEILRNISKAFLQEKIEAYYVGGCVRDWEMGLEPEDIDICLVGVKNYKDVKRILLPFCSDVIEAVGKQFPNWIAVINGRNYDFALARTEKKVGQTRQDFLCSVEDVTIEQDLERRDLTINSIAKHVLTGEIIDPFNGRLHIKQKVAHPTSRAFGEDPLRVVRAARFVARYELVPTLSLIVTCYRLTNEGLSAERVGGELKKVFMQAKKPSLFFNFLREVCWLGYYFEELESLIDIPQSPTHHPEGDAYTHTLLTIDAATGWFTRAVMLCHDLGKGLKTTINGIPYGDFNWSNGIPNGAKISSVGHEEAGIELTKNILKRIRLTNNDAINQIACLVELHMIRIYGDNPPTKVVRRTLRRLMHYELDYMSLYEVVLADLSGRPPLPVPETLDIGQEEAARLLSKNEMTPVVTGRMLRRQGIKPGPEMGAMIRTGLELQDRGTLNASNWKARLRGYGFKCLQKTDE